MSDQYFTPCPSNDHCNYSPIVGKSQNFRKDSLVVVVLVGASSVVLTVYTSPDLKYLTATSQDIELTSPQHGWYEQDPEEVVEAIHKCSADICQMLHVYDFTRSDIKAVAVTSQRETTVVWHALTGKPLYKAIAANDRRGLRTAERIISTLPKHDQNHFKSITGAPISADCLAVKLRWLRDNVLAVKEAISEGNCRVGTMDSWIIWNLTLGSLHVTDVTNASRTLLMNLSTLKWDGKLLKIFCVDKKMLPEIRNCAETLGTISSPLSPLRHVKLGAIIADQLAAFLGQMCLHFGQINANFDSSCCILCNIGTKMITCNELLTTVAYKFDTDASCVYALEGQVPACGQLLNWLQFKLHLLPDADEAKNYASSVRNTGDVYFVPAFTGLQAPFWRKDARGTIIGLTDRTTKMHLVRAAYEAICFQNYDIINAMRNTHKSEQDVIFACGALASNELLMQMQADIAGVSVVKYNDIDAISYGAAICAARAIAAVDMRRFQRGIWRHSIDYETFPPRRKMEHRILRYVKWRRAMARSVNWTRVQQRRKHEYLFVPHLTTVAVAVTMVFVLVNAFKVGIRKA